eukprot:7336721-Alexandrium_andersonii.AAC.1
MRVRPHAGAICSIVCDSLLVPCRISQGLEAIGVPNSLSRLQWAARFDGLARPSPVKRAANHGAG